MRPGTDLSLQRLTVDRLGSDIATGRIAVGSTLDPVRLAEELGVSRTVIREAFRTLEALGLIVARPRIGTIVQPRSGWDLLDGRVIGWRDAGPEADRQLEDLTLLREAVEPAAAARASERATELDLAAMDASVLAMATAMQEDDVAGFARADEALHAAIVRAAGSPVLDQLQGTLEAALRSRYAGRFPAFGDAAALALERHGEVVGAIRARDPDRAATAMRRLIREARDEALGIRP